MSSSVVLLLDEEDSRRTLHAFGLRCAGLVVEEAASVDHACRRLLNRCADLVLIVCARLDQRLCAFVGRLRANPFTHDLPVLLEAECATRAEAATAYERGFSDFLLGPIVPEELITRVRAALGCAVAIAPVTHEFAGLEIAADAGAVRKGARSVALRPTEKRLLEFMFAHPEQVVPRELLLFRIWGGGAQHDSRVVDVTVCRLRRALSELGSERVLRTVNRHGYKLTVN